MRLTCIRGGVLSLLAVLGLCTAERGAAAGVFTEISIDYAVNADLSTYTRGDLYPAGGTALSIGGVPFTLATGGSGGPGIFQTDTSDSLRISSIIPVNVYGVGTLYTLVNSIFGAAPNVNGSIEFIGSGGADVVFDFTQGTNIRDHFNGFYNNVVTDPGIATATYSDPSNGDEVRLDRQTFVLPSAFATQTLTDIVFTGFNGFPDFSPGQPFLAGVTVETVPEPAGLVMWSIGGAVSVFAGWCRRRPRA